MKSTLILVTLLFCSLSYGQVIQAMTYNIRLDNAGDGANRWDLRKENLVKQLKFYEPDIFGIQEGLPQQVHYLADQLPGYRYIGVGRDDGIEKGEFSAVYYKNESLKLIKGSTFWLSPTPELPSKGWDAALPRICTYGLFERISDGQRFWFFNTHFDHVGKRARVESMKVILKKMELLNPDHLPIILTGDLNVTPDEAPIQEMKKVLTDVHDIAQLVFGPEATFNGFHFDQIPQVRIDYIAVSPGVMAKKYAVLTDSYNQKYISDHFAVFCTLSFTD